MKKNLSLMILAVMLTFTAKGAWADDVQTYQVLNQLLGTTFASNADANSLLYTGSTSTWTQTNNGGYTAAAVGVASTGQSSFETYNPSTPNNLSNPFNAYFTGNTILYNGTSYPGEVISNASPAGTQIGFALNQVGNNGTTDWYSNPALNSDLMDHMVVYDLSPLDNTLIDLENPATFVDPQAFLQDPYLLVFDDTAETDSTPGTPGDPNSNDLFVLVDGVTPVSAVPEPMTLPLFAVGLIAMTVFTQRRKLAFLTKGL